MMGRVASEIGRVCSIRLRMQLRTMTKKPRKHALPTQPPQMPTCDIGPCPPSFYCCSPQSCNPPVDKPNPIELCPEMSAMSSAPLCYSPNYQPCYPSTPQGCPALCCPPRPCTPNCPPSRSTSCLGGRPVEACSSCVAGCYCSYCQQPCCPQQDSQPCSFSGNQQFCRSPSRLVCCCCPSCGSPPFNMTGPPPCCTISSHGGATPSYAAQPRYGLPPCYGAAPCYGAPCYGDMGNQCFPCAMPWSQSQMQQATGKIPLPHEHTPVSTIKKEIQKPK